MAHVIGRIKVKDYDQFEKAFAGKAEARKAKGCERVSIYRDPADRNSFPILNNSVVRYVCVESIKVPQSKTSSIEISNKPTRTGCERTRNSRMAQPGVATPLSSELLSSRGLLCAIIRSANSSRSARRAT